MCRQVEVEIHETLLKYDGLIEPAATNQGAWLTESAGALSVLHSAVLTSLAGFSVDKRPTPASYGSTLSAEEAEARAQEDQALPTGTGNSYGGREPTVCGPTQTGEDPRRTSFRGDGDGSTLAEEWVISGAGAGAGAEATALRDVATSDGCSGGAPRDGTWTITMAVTTATPPTTTVSAGRGLVCVEEERDQRRKRLQNLGLLLARRRQFTASRQVCFV